MKHEIVDGAVTPSQQPQTPWEIATQAHANQAQRKIAFWTALASVPPAIGVGVGLLARSRKAGVIAGATTAVVLGAVRWQLQRLWTDEPDFVVEQTLGDLEIRRYLPSVEARTQLEQQDFDAAVDAGFDRLAGYIFGGNRRKQTKGERLAMTTPVLTRANAGGHAMTFVMPPGRDLASLPEPTDDRIELAETPSRRVAVLAYRGRFRREVIAEHERELRSELAAAGLVTKGEAMVAGFDPPWTLPLLRRTEIWIELT